MSPWFKRIGIAGGVSAVVAGGIFLIGSVHGHSMPGATISDPLPIGAPLTGKVSSLTFVHEGEGDLRSQWPETILIPAGTNYRVARVAFPSQIASAEIIQAITPECEAGGHHVPVCPTLVSAMVGQDAGTAHSFAVRSCYLSKNTTMVISSSNDPVLNCHYELDDNGIEN